MTHVTLFLFALGLGIVAAIPLGGCQVEMAKRAIGGHLPAAWMVVCGSATSDLVYGTVALFAVAPLLDYPRVALAFNVLGVALLWVLAYLTYRQSQHPEKLALDNPALKSRRWAYLTGFFLGFSNPPIVLSWLLGLSLARQMGLASPLTGTLRLAFLAGGTAGLGGYLAVLAVFLHRVKHFISIPALGRVYFWLGISLFLLSFYFAYGAAKYFNPAI